VKTEVFYYKTRSELNLHVRSMRFSILHSLDNSSDKTQMMYSTKLLCLLTSKYDINGSRLNYSTVSRNKFKYINMKTMYKDMCCSQNTSRNKIGNLYS